MGLSSCFKKLIEIFYMSYPRQVLQGKKPYISFRILRFLKVIIYYFLNFSHAKNGIEIKPQRMKIFTCVLCCCSDMER